ncbi:MAG: kirHV [Pseudonocardiales bacterium]|nr:kirHV [Pseudonocardiales bacterium]
MTASAPGEAGRDHGPYEYAPYEYALVRVSPRVDRGECVNVGVVLYSQGAQYLAVDVHLDVARLSALHPGVDVEAITEAVEAFAAAAGVVPEGNPREGGGMGAHFRWLTAPRSTVVHAGPVHAGMTDDPPRELGRLMGKLVR